MIATPQSQVTIAIAGDIHQQWDDNDVAVLQALQVDLVLFVGDFGNEDLAVVRQIAALPLAKAVICGNHDAWYTATPWGRRKRPYNPALEDRVQAQLEVLGPVHVGYGHLDFPHLGLSVVGARPFSWGGSQWRNRTFYRERYGVSSFEDSTAKIIAAAQQATQPHLIFIGHNGPTGLGEQPEDICGKDWKPIGGDYGDPDFAAAIAQLHPQLEARGQSIPLIAFGHMHHRLRHRKDRLRTAAVVRRPDHRLYLNAARCPRMIETEAGVVRNFSLVTLIGGAIATARLVWLNLADEIIQAEDLLAGAQALD